MGLLKQRQKFFNKNRKMINFENLKLVVLFRYSYFSTFYFERNQVNLNCIVYHGDGSVIVPLKKSNIVFLS